MMMMKILKIWMTLLMTMLMTKVMKIKATIFTWSSFLGVPVFYASVRCRNNFGVTFASFGNSSALMTQGIGPSPILKPEKGNDFFLSCSHGGSTKSLLHSVASISLLFFSSIKNSISAFKGLGCTLQSEVGFLSSDQSINQKNQPK